MEDAIILVDDGFFGLVKKHFQREGGKSKRYLQTFRNICKKEKFSTSNQLLKVASKWIRLKEEDFEDA